MIRFFSLFILIIIIDPQFCLLPRFRQYGFWDRYANLFPKKILSIELEEVTTTKIGFLTTTKIGFLGNSMWQCEFISCYCNIYIPTIFNHWIRNIGSNTYKSTTLLTKFNLWCVNPAGIYVLRIAMASAHRAKLQVLNFNANHFDDGAYIIYIFSCIGSRLIILL